jgi:peptide/nickel transport system permease protein
MIKLALVIVSLWVLMALFAFGLGDGANAVNLDQLLTPPHAGQWLGHDELGRSVWQRLMLGAQTSLFVAIGVVSLSALIGISLGLLSGYLGGWFDRVMVKVIDVFLAFPGLLLSIALAAVLGPGIENVIMALAAVGWVGFARLTRAQTLSVKNREHVTAARALGVGSPTIMRRHILPLVSAPLLVEATFGFAGAVIAEAGLSFLGLGVQPPAASLGNMIREGTRYLLVAPHLVLIPGLALLLMVLAINILGDRLRDRFDVRENSQRKL